MEEKKKRYWAQDFATMKIENDLWIILVFSLIIVTAYLQCFIV